MHGTLEHGNPLVNGYSGHRSPLHHLLAGHALQDYESYGLLLRGLRAIDVRYVAVHEERFADPGFARTILTTLLRETDQIIESSSDGQTFRELYRGRGFPRLLLGVLEGEPFAPMDFALPQNELRVIRLRQTGSDPVFYWSIHEIELWRR